MKSKKICLMELIAVVIIFLIAAPIAYAGSKGKDNTNFLHGKPFKYLQEQIDNLDSRVIEVEGDIAGIKEEMDALIQIILNFQDNISQIRQELLTLQDDVEANGNAITLLEAKLVDLQNQVESKVAELLQVVKNIKIELQTQITLLLQQISEYGELITQNQDSIASLQNDLEYYVVQLNEVTGNVADNQEEINYLQNQCIVTQTEINSIQTDINLLNQNIVSNQEEINSLWQEIESISYGRQVINASPNTNVTITDTKDRLWLFIGSVNYYCSPAHEINARLIVDGAQIDSWKQGNTIFFYSQSDYTFNFVKLYLLPSGTHTVKFDYELLSLFGYQNFGVRSDSFIGITVE